MHRPVSNLPLVLTNLIDLSHFFKIHNEEINDLLNHGQPDDKGLAIRENTSGEIKVIRHLILNHALHSLRTNQERKGYIEISSVRHICRADFQGGGRCAPPNVL